MISNMIAKAAAHFLIGHVHFAIWCPTPEGHFIGIPSGECGPKRAASRLGTTVAYHFPTVRASRFFPPRAGTPCPRARHADIRSIDPPLVADRGLALYNGHIFTTEYSGPEGPAGLEYDTFPRAQQTPVAVVTGSVLKTPEDVIVGP